MRIIKQFVIIIYLRYIIACTDSELITNLINRMENKSISKEKKYSLKTLGYITPWNKEGYKLVEQYANKFDIISPTWFELEPEELDGEFQMILESGNNVDSTLIKNLQKKNIQVLPRIHCEKLNPSTYELWLMRDTKQFLKVLERRIKYNNLDGFVLDCIYLWQNQEIYENFVNNLLPKLKELMEKLNKMLIITLLSTSENNLLSVIDRNKFKFLSKYVDFINIMTYDYGQYRSSLDKVYSAPISWIKKTINFYVDIKDKNKDEILSKILFGIPFHGYAYNKSSKKEETVLNSSQYINLLKNNINKCKLKWDNNESEHIIEINNEKIIVYPTKEYIIKRLELSKDLKLGGCGIWDIGNGNDYLLESF